MSIFSHLWEFLAAGGVGTIFASVVSNHYHTYYSHSALQKHVKRDEPASLEEIKWEHQLLTNRLEIAWKAKDKIIHQQYARINQMQQKFQAQRKLKKTQFQNITKHNQEEHSKVINQKENQIKIVQKQKKDLSKKFVDLSQSHKRLQTKLKEMQSNNSRFGSIFSKFAVTAIAATLLVGQTVYYWNFPPYMWLIVFLIATWVV